MIWSLVILIMSVVADIVLSYGPLWRWRLPGAVVAGLLIVAAAAGLAYQAPGWLSIPVIATSAYRLIHLRRIVHDSNHPYYIRHMVRQTAWWLGPGQLVVAGCLAALHQLGHVAWWPAGWTLMAALQLAVAVAAYSSLRRQLRTTNPSLAVEQPAMPTASLPSLTVAIPAHHPVEQLRACIDAVLASDYPKMEILVLDDHPQTKASELIKMYAHDGVRFVRAQTPRNDWLAKNQAYTQLAAEASGDVLLFCGPDIRFGRSSIRTLVQLMLTRNKAMMCVLPLNTQARRVPLLQSMRYYWEMVPPRRLFKRPPVMGSCWLIRRTELDKAGGFAATSRSITPEAHFARSLLAEDGYSFIRSGQQLAVTSQKSLAEQQATATVTRYPQLHRRIELVTLLVFAELLLILAPAGLALAAWLLSLGWVCVVLALASTIVHGVTFYNLQRVFFPKVSLLNSVGSLYAAMISDIYQLHVSMWKYEFSTVYWRDRDVSRQIMRRQP